MAKVYGIDLGTVNSCIACLDEFGQADLIPNSMGNRTTPSVVYFSPDGQSYTVGEIAKNGMVSDHASTVSCIKREMGTVYTKPTGFPRGLTPAEISSYILKTLVKEANAAEEARGEKPCFDVVITCPAYFGSDERKQTREAGQLAGLNVLRLINEPTAAAIAYGLKHCRDGKEQYILVYDLGGGTFDVTLVRLCGKSFKAIATGGDKQLGGKDWDLCLAEKLLQEFNRKTGSSYSFDGNVALLNHFMLIAEDTKHSLSSKSSVQTNVGWDGKSTLLQINGRDFEKWTEHLLEKTITATRDVLAQAERKNVRLTADTTVVLVGGSTKMPQVIRRLEQEFASAGCKILKRSPEECVAKGAAQIGDIIEEPSDITFYDVSSKTYGTDAKKQGDSTEYVRNLIFANTELPARSEIIFHTAVPNQEAVSLKIFESNSLQKTIPVSEAKVIDGVHTLKLPPNLPAHTEITVFFELDCQGVLHVQAKTESSDVCFEVNI